MPSARERVNGRRKPSKAHRKANISSYFCQLMHDLLSVDKNHFVCIQKSFCLYSKLAVLAFKISYVGNGNFEASGITVGLV